MITVVYCTRKSNRKHYDHIRKSSGLTSKIEVIEIVNEGESLTKAYNRGLKEATNDIVVFCHDDIVFTKDGWGRKLIKHFNKSDFGILGIAGTTDMDVSGRWWTDASKMVGVVKHSHEGRTWESKYSGNFTDRIIETVTVDGLFFVVHKDRIKETFDEAVEGFHFYEVNFNLRNHLAGVKIGVIFDVKVTHKSIGQTNDEWEKNRIKFSEEFKDKLPRKIDVVPFKNEREIKLRAEPKVKIIVSGNGDTKKMKVIHKNLSDSIYTNYDINLVVNEDDVDAYEKLKLDNVIVNEGVYSSIHKNISVLKWDDDFINEDDELVFFLSDKATLETDVLTKFVSIYNKDKKSFGAVFPRILQEDNTILATGIIINIIPQEDDKTQINYNLKGVRSYYNYREGVQLEPLGNFGFCFMTTQKNLEKHGWFRLDFNELLYEVDYSIKCSLDNKKVFVDNDSIIKLDEIYSDNEENVKKINEDFNVLVGTFNENRDAVKFLNVVPPRPQQQPQQQPQE